MHSPDRRYWWDGSEWRLAVSRDGQLWFDGTTWVPNPLMPPGLPRLPTRWTRPLQVAVVGVALLGFVSFVAALPLVASMPTPTVVLVPEATSPEEAARLAQTMRPVMVASLIFQAVLFGAVAALIVIGSIRRWRWMFWAVLVLLGLNVVDLLIPLLLGVVGRLPATPPPGVVPSRPPPVPMVIGVAGTLAQAATAVLFVAMVVAAVRIGPWACRRAAEVAPAAPPAGA